MSQPKFAVSRFKNRNGVISFRVDGHLHGVRVRNNFKTREEAVAEKAALDVKALQAEASLWSTSTFLSADQLHEAESVFRRLEGRSLTFYTDYALTNHRQQRNRNLLKRPLTLMSELRPNWMSVPESREPNTAFPLAPDSTWAPFALKTALPDSSAIARVAVARRARRFRPLATNAGMRFLSDERRCARDAIGLRRDFAETTARFSSPAESASFGDLNTTRKGHPP